MQRKLCAFRQTTALCVGQNRGIKHRSLRREADLRQACGNNGVLRFRGRMAQGVRKFGIKDQVLWDALRIEGNPRIGKGQIGRKLGLGRAEQAQGGQAQLILDVERVPKVVRAIHADPAPDHKAIIGAVDAGQTCRKGARPVRPDQRKVSGIAPGRPAADIAEGIAVRVPQLEGVIARGGHGRNGQDHGFAADIDEGLGIDRVIVRRCNLLELGAAQVANQTELVDRRLRVSLGNNVGACPPAHQLLEQDRGIPPDDGIRAEEEGFRLWPAQPGQIRRRSPLVFGLGHRGADQGKRRQRRQCDRPKLGTPTVARLRV